MAKRYRRREASEWRAIIERQQASVQSQARFCQAEGLALSTFSCWRRILQQSGVRAAALESQAERESVDTPMFTVLTEPAPGEHEGLEGERGWEMELELGPGVRLRIRRLVA